jgi:hypothetical protein
MLKVTATASPQRRISHAWEWKAQSQVRVLARVLPKSTCRRHFFVADFLTLILTKKRFVAESLLWVRIAHRSAWLFHARREAVCLRKKVHVERCLGIVLPSTVKCSCERVVGSESGEIFHWARLAKTTTLSACDIFAVLML